MTTTDPTFTARDNDTIDRILDSVTKLRLAVDALDAQVAESNRRAAQAERERRRTPVAHPVTPPRPVSFTPYIVIPLIASSVLTVAAALHGMGIL